jgi:Formyl transferase
MNVIVVTHDSIFGRYLAATLATLTRIDRLIIETQGPSLRFAARKLQRVGVVDFSFQILLNRWFRREARKHLPDLSLPAHERVATVNDCSFGANDLVIGFGTSYVHARTLTRIPRGMLNLHTGLLPEYRGVKSEFWALASGERRSTGWTLHFMSPELDAGDIVMRKHVEPNDDDPASLRARLLRDAVVDLSRFLEQTRAHGFASIPRQPQGEGRYFSTPRWADWRRWRGRGRAAAR